MVLKHVLSVKDLIAIIFHEYVILINKLLYTVEPDQTKQIVWVYLAAT